MCTSPSSRTRVHFIFRMSRREPSRFAGSCSRRASIRSASPVRYTTTPASAGRSFAGGRSMDGLLVIDKPVGPTSHDVVARMRRVLGERRIGHTGTLDPNASGVLPLVIGKATRLAKFLSGGGKTYEALVHLGVATDTYD